MKLMKKALVLALAAAAILLPMTGCKTDVDSGSPAPATQEGTGTGPTDTTTSGGGANGGNDAGAGAGASTNGYVTLPENKGSDPFAGLTELTPSSTYEINHKYSVDTTNRTLTYLIQNLDTGQFMEYDSYSYSYDSTTTPATITIRTEKIHSYGKQRTLQDYFKDYENILKSQVESEIQNIIDSKQNENESMLTYYNEQYGLNLTAADFTEEKKAATLEAIWNSPKKQEEVAKSKAAEIAPHMFPRTYTVALISQSGTSGTIAFAGQYNTNYKWYKQPAGIFEITGSGELMKNFGLHLSGTYYGIVAIDDDTISLDDYSDTGIKPLSYATTGTGNDMRIIINVDGTTYTATWSPATINLSAYLYN